MQGFRQNYKHGVDTYYESIKDRYSNPHHPQIEYLLKRNASKIDCTLNVLDLCAGTGEVTAILLALGIKNISGCDPYLYESYKGKTSLKCQALNFTEIMQFDLGDEIIYSSIICSFAMHLCPNDALYNLILALSYVTKQLIIITPHKRPDLSGINLCQLVYENHVLTDKGKKVFLKIYNLNSISNYNISIFGN